MTTEDKPVESADLAAEANEQNEGGTTPSENDEANSVSKKKVTKKPAAKKGQVDTSSLTLEKNLVSSTAEVVERRNRVEQLLESAEQGKDKVKPEIYERVTEDYRSQLSEIAAEYAPLRTQVISELQRIREQEVVLQGELDKLNEYLDEIRFRCQVGEFGENELKALEEEKKAPGHELDTKLKAVDKTFKTAEDLLGEDVEAAVSGVEPEPEPEPEPVADEPIPDGTVMMSTSELPSVPDGPVPDGTVMMSEADLPSVPDGPVPDGTVMMGGGEMPAVPDGPVPDGTVMMGSGEQPASTDEMPRALLTRTKPKGGKVFVINLDELTLGRSTSNDVVIEGASVSRRHATIKYEDGAYIIQDHSSGGGILVNGERFKQIQLSTGDEISIGSSVFEFEGP